MSTHIAVGQSLLAESTAAGREAARDALGRMGVVPDAVRTALVFATAPHDQAGVLAGVRAAVPGAQITGCSGEGVIVQHATHERDRAVAVLLCASPTLTLDPRVYADYDADPAARGRALADDVNACPDAIAVLVFPDGLTGNCTALLDALQARLTRSVPILGGTSADAMALERTYQYGPDGASTNAVTAVIVRGQGRLEFAVSHGCMPIGLERTVTRAEGGWVQEIDGRPAWDVFKEYLEGDPPDLQAEGVIHLCIGKPLDDTARLDYDAPHVIHTPLHLDKETGALFFPGGGLSSGERIRLTRRDAARIRETALGCAQKLVRPEQRPAAVFQFDCAGRGRALFGSYAADEIVRPLQAELGTDVPWIGFHTFGEIAPIGGRSYYHNYTVVLCALYDAS